MHFFFLLLFLLPLLSLSDPDTTGCSSSQYECGSRAFDIHYPFRLKTSQAHCGHPDFNLYCDDYAGSLFINISEKSYRVNYISYKDKLLQLTDTSLLLINQTCPLPSSNVSFSSSLYDYSAFDTNLTFYLNCTRSLPGLRNVSCSGNEPGYLSYYRFANDLLPVRGQYCKSIVVVPLTGDLTVAGGETDLAAAMKRGFGLTWKVDGWCGKCEDSNGVCGNDPNSGEDACLCSNAASINGICQPFSMCSDLL